ncbi:unnamed protein product [Adineta steineri]|uniref:G-protein coupled receptors family 1 profile domain-containing protein n=1 Tax=Adineta steineri TaxID=433720 RepID=A0A815RSE2_9BILA|nr:unnamed protein product [Adineta steineri]CAF1511144.1 unnamed protein product [Adineta steineri]CAF1517923.1 unnamed protein product [Adineta steineri]CAF1649261.1 unnamed protein product [Adineta steineri]CAF4012113.1 unnamed protein product [Adineta steineri]
MSLQYAGEQLTAYGGIFLLVTGVTGDALNIFIFLTIRIYRTTPCTFFFLVGLTHDIGQLLISLTELIFKTGYGIDPTRTSTFLCKSRLYLVNGFATVSLSCSCLAVIDQFLVTSRSARLRGWSNITWAYRLALVAFSIAWLTSIPIAIHTEILPTISTCIPDANLTAYLPFASLLTLSALPVSVMLTFGYLAYRNIRLTTALTRHRVDRQLTRMICMQVILIAVCQIPYGIFNAYTLLTANVTKDADRLDKELFASRIAALLNYGTSSGNFYVFLVTSSRFRQIVKDKIFWWRPQNQIGPVTVETT